MENQSEKIPKAKNIQSVLRATKIMEFLAANSNSASLTTISKNLDLSKSTVHGLIATLERLGYIYQDQLTGAYSLGLKLFELGQVVYSSLDLRSIARPYLLDLGKKYEETIHLALLTREDVVYIEKVDSTRSIRIISQIGGRNPAYCTGVGKVLLAGLSDSEVEKIIAVTGMKKLTENTIDNIVVLKENLAKIREQGYAYDLEEIEIGLRCVAAPVTNHEGKVIAAISLSGPNNRITDEMLEQLAKDIMITAKHISDRLGSRK
jgi:DNA-binding IclR family transcriptional regulator